MSRRVFALLYFLFAILFSFFEITGQYTAGAITIGVMLAEILGAFVLAFFRPEYADYFFSRNARWSDTL